MSNQTRRSTRVEGIASDGALRQGIDGEADFAHPERIMSLRFTERI
jgi:hypothetical protein